MTENNGFYYNAPNYHDFSSNIVVEGVDSFFDYAHNHDCSQTVSDLEKPLMTLPKIKIEVISPDNEQTLKISSSPNNIFKESQNITSTMTPRLIKKGIRRSSILQPAFHNVEDILIQDMENLEVIPLQGKLSTTKCHHMTTRLDKCIATPKLDLRSRSVVRSDTVNENRKRKGSPTQETQNKFMGMEERIMRFENSSRFPSQELSKNVQKNKKLHTVAKSPNLMAIHRTRPVNFTTHQEKEELELQEMKTNQIKAAPFNKAILEKVSVPVKPAAKPTTKPYPFKLTEITKKPVASVEPYHFSAKPIPEAVLNSPKLRPLRNRPLKVPVLQVSLISKNYLY
uniref:TPX2 central domain-containing protein n=1 Tax=Clastoptera arizonana TaxID=38151 RepID=A0A1B6DUD4_9HEMI